MGWYIPALIFQDFLVAFKCITLRSGVTNLICSLEFFVLKMFLLKACKNGQYDESVLVLHVGTLLLDDANSFIHGLGNIFLRNKRKNPRLLSQE